MLINIPDIREHTSPSPTPVQLELSHPTLAAIHSRLSSHLAEFMFACVARKCAIQSILVQLHKVQLLCGDRYVDSIF